MSRVLHICRECEGTTFTLAAPIGNQFVVAARDIKVITCMFCGSQEPPLERTVNMDGKIIKTGIRHIPNVQEGSAPDCFEAWFGLSFRWRDEFNRRLK